MQKIIKITNMNVFIFFVDKLEKNCCGFFIDDFWFQTKEFGRAVLMPILFSSPLCPKNNLLRHRVRYYVL